ncbi:tetratricopeptide repeat protein [Microcoleus sp. MON1_C1]|uniref:tetratricopeptide repeat protein n=1 Tax=Microcoleus sp. MON1_C1 TaxID=2818827 RepID=UPI002FCE9A1E
MNNLDSIHLKIASYQQSGHALAKDGRVNEAILAYEEALKLQPDAEIYFHLGSLLTLSGKIDKAIAAYQKAVEIQPDYVDSYWNLAWLFSQQNKWDEAITSTRKAGELKIQGVWEHFQKNSRYRFIKLHSLSEEDRIFLENIEVSIANLELINQVNVSAKQSYQDVWSYSPEMPISNFGISSSLHSIIDKGYVESICPVSGKKIKSDQSFYVDHYQYMIFYRFLGTELFYLVVGGNWVRFNIAIYFPFKDLIISFCDPTNGIMMEAAPVDYWVNIFKSYTLSCLNDVKDYLLSDQPKKISAVLGMWNIGHYFWNEISAIQELYETKKLNKVDAYVIGPNNYLDIQDIFPEIRAEKPNVDFFYFQAQAPYWYLHAELPQPTYFQFCLTNNFFTVKLTALCIKEKLASRIYHNSYKKCRPNFLQKVAKSKQHFPLLWISIRSHTREWISQVEGIANIIRDLSNDFPTLGVIFDGMPTEKANMEKILELIPPNISTYNALDCEIHETFVWVYAIDLFIMGYGAGSVFPWIANKIGLYHGNTHMVRYEEAFCIHPRENCQHTFFVSRDAITEDLDSVSHPHTRNYDVDWRAIYNKVVKIIEKLNEERIVTSE